ncbi:hypothetical protein ABT332_21200 [Saccharomonospora azurea]
MRRVVLVAYDEAQLLDISCTTDVFDGANRLGVSPAYECPQATFR